MIVSRLISSLINLLYNLKNANGSREDTCQKCAPFTQLQKNQSCVIIPKSCSRLATGKLFPYVTKNKDYVPFLKTQLK